MFTNFYRTLVSGLLWFGALSMSWCIKNLSSEVGSVYSLPSISNYKVSTCRATDILSQCRQVSPSTYFSNHQIRHKRRPFTVLASELLQATFLMMFRTMKRPSSRKVRVTRNTWGSSLLRVIITNSLDKLTPGHRHLQHPINRSICSRSNTEAQSHHPQQSHASCAHPWPNLDLSTRTLSYTLL